MPEDKDKVKKLDRLLSLLDPENSLTKKDFEAAFSKVVDLVKTILQKHEQAIRTLETQYSSLTDKLRQDHTSSLTELKDKTNQLFVGERLSAMDSETKTEFKKLQSSLNQIADTKLRELEGRVYDLKPIKGDRGDKGDTGPMPTEHLQLMKDMMAEMKRIQDILSNISRGKGMGRAKIQIVRAVDLSSQVDGVVTDYTLPMDTVSVLFVWSTQFPTILQPVTDFTLSGRTLTLTSQVGVIQSGQTLTALCEVLFSP